jgi:hypothetical protein
MNETINAVTYMLHHDPWPIAGMILLGAFAVLFAYVQFKMRAIGYKTYPLFARPSDWGLPNHYLKVRAEHNWSAWPVYIMWSCLPLGVFLLVLGLFRLQR